MISIRPRPIGPSPLGLANGLAKQRRPLDWFAVLLHLASRADCRCRAGKQSTSTPSQYFINFSYSASKIHFEVGSSLPLPRAALLTRVAVGDAFK